MRNIPTIGHDDAADAVEAIRAALARRGQSAVIAVVDVAGELLAFLRTDGAPVSPVGVAMAKARTAARLKRATRVLGESIRARDIDIAYYADAGLTGFAGGVPAWLGREVVGAVAVSGLSEAEDEELAALGIGAMRSAGLASTAG